jgi:hypothetical protein
MSQVVTAKSLALVSGARLSATPLIMRVTRRRTSGVMARLSCVSLCALAGGVRGKGV